MADKELKDLIKQIKEMNKESPDTDIASSKEFRELSKSLHERHDATEENTKALKEDAETNKNFNKIQIAKEAFDFATGRDNAASLKKTKASLDRQDKGLALQKKHNKGAKDAREIILEQNKIIIGQLNQLQKGIGGGGNPNVDKALVENTKVIKKNQADISKADQTTVGPNGEKLNTRAKDPVKALAEDIRISQGVVGTTRNREQFRASKASGALAEKMGANAGALQQAMEGNDEAKTDLADLARILSDAQAGKEGVGKKGD